MCGDIHFGMDETFLEQLTHQTKVQALESLDDRSAYCIGDWMMKTIPQHFREKMDDWFGKRGISVGHVTAFIMKEGQYKKATYFTFIDKCVQDGHTLTCVFEDVIKQYKDDFPLVNKIHSRNDNATCYLGGAVLMAKVHVCNEANLEISALDFNKAQKRKDQCDRYAAVAKRCIRSYLNSGKDVFNAEDIKEALDSTSGTLPNTKTSVVKVMPNYGSIDKAQTDNITRYHYFKVEEHHLECGNFVTLGLE